MFGCNYGCSCNRDDNYNTDMGGECYRGCYSMDWRARRAYWAGYQNGYRQGCYEAPFCHRNTCGYDEE